LQWLHHRHAVGACVLQLLSTGLELFGVSDNFKLIAIGAVIVLAVLPDAYRGRFLRALEAR